MTSKPFFRCGVLPFVPQPGGGGVKIASGDGMARSFPPSFEITVVNLVN